MNKVVIITGANRGIGKGMVHVFAEKGYDIFLAFFGEQEKAENVAKEVREKYGRRCVLFDGDLSDAQVCRELVDTAVKEYGHIDALCSNAGVGYERYISAADVSELDFVYKINFRAGILLAKYVAEHMINNQIKGSIVLTTSVKATTSNAIDCIYGSMKAALKRAVRSMAVEYGPRGVRINTIAPGCIAVYTKGYEHLNYDNIVKYIPVGRTGIGEDIGYAAAFLCSEEAGFITGTEILVDGGEKCGAPADEVMDKDGINGLGTYIYKEEK